MLTQLNVELYRSHTKLTLLQLPEYNFDRIDLVNIKPEMQSRGF